MDPTKAMQFQTFPHPHAGTMGPSGINTPHQIHSRNGSQSMPRQGNRRYDRVGSQGKNPLLGAILRELLCPCTAIDCLNTYGYMLVKFTGNGSIYSPGPEYDDPANCAPEDEQYGSQYGGYGAPYDQYGSRGSIGRRSLGEFRSVESWKLGFILKAAMFDVLVDVLYQNPISKLLTPPSGSLHPGYGTLPRSRVSIANPSTAQFNTIPGHFALETPISFQIVRLRDITESDFHIQLA